eukprot:Pgem_evm1s1012
MIMEMPSRPPPILSRGGGRCSTQISQKTKSNENNNVNVDTNNNNDNNFNNHTDNNEDENENDDDFQNKIEHNNTSIINVATSNSTDFNPIPPRPKKAKPILKLNKETPVNLKYTLPPVLPKTNPNDHKVCAITNNNNDNNNNNNNNTNKCDNGSDSVAAIITNVITKLQSIDIKDEESIENVDFVDYKRFTILHTNTGKQLNNTRDNNVIGTNNSTSSVNNTLASSSSSNNNNNNNSDIVNRKQPTPITTLSSDSTEIPLSNSISLPISNRPLPTPAAKQNTTTSSSNNNNNNNNGDIVNRKPLTSISSDTTKISLSNSNSLPGFSRPLPTPEKQKLIITSTKLNPLTSSSSSPSSPSSKLTLKSESTKSMTPPSATNSKLSNLKSPRTLPVIPVPRSSREHNKLYRHSMEGQPSPNVFHEQQYSYLNNVYDDSILTTTFGHRRSQDSHQESEMIRPLPSLQGKAKSSSR